MSTEAKSVSPMDIKSLDSNSSEFITIKHKLLDKNNSKLYMPTNKSKAYVGTKYWKALENLTPEQKKVLIESYGVNFGNKVNTGTLLSAIAWIESDLGRDKGHNRYIGIYQVDPHIVLKTPEFNLEGYKSISTIKKRLLTDHAYAKRIAIAELKYWSKYWTVHKKHTKNIELKAIASYNVGVVGMKSKQAAKYAEDVLYRAKVIAAFIESKGMHPHIASNITLYNILS
jgi:hypothetical protein